MADNLPLNIFPDKFRILSGSMLKLIACVAMLIDHTGAVILSNYSPALNPLFYIGDNAVSAYRIARDIGRCAFPIFCFLIIEGFLHTHDRRKYGRNLLLFALISEIPWNFMFVNTWHYERQNVFFTLLLGYLALCAIEYFWETPQKQFAALFLLLIASILLKADYGWRGYIFIILMYLLRNERVSQAIVGSCWLYYEWKACFAFISINLYNGKRGFIKGKAAKYFFYLFYPLHITILVLIRNRFFL